MLFLVNLLLVQGHVRMFYDSGTGATPRSIRNANSPMSDGSFSTAGPCGGVSAWKLEQANNVAPGESVTMIINYNGGHKSNANEFAIRWACGESGSGPTEAQMKAATDLPAGTCNVIRCPEANTYPCPAAIGNQFTEGYTFQCTVPPNAAGKDCTYSVLDQRDWGGCVDLRVSNTPAVETTMPESTQQAVPVQTQAPNFDASMAQDFKFTGDNVIVESPKYPNCCCTMDQGTDEKNRFAVSTTGVLTGTLRMVCPQEIEFWQKVKTSETQLNLQLTFKSTNNWEGTTKISGQEMTFNLIKDGPGDSSTLYYTNTGLDAPHICDGYIKQLESNMEFASFEARSKCPEMAQAAENALFNGDGTASVASLSLFLAFSLILALL